MTGAPLSRNILFSPGPLIPNFFQRLLPDDPGLYGDWILGFRNGSDTASVTVSLADNAKQAPFVNSITLSGSSDKPTFTWTPPPDTVVNGYRVNFYDKSLITGNNNGQVASINLQPSVTSHTVTAADFTVQGNALQLNKNYVIEISLIQTKDGSSNLNNSNLQAIARTYADFTPQAGGGPVVNLPVVLDNGSFKFNMTVQPGVTYYIDPEVATGYDYGIGAGDPNFQTVDLPDNIGDGLYNIWCARQRQRAQAAGRQLEGYRRVRLRAGRRRLLPHPGHRGIGQPQPGQHHGLRHRPDLHRRWQLHRHPDAAADHRRHRARAFGAGLGGHRAGRVGLAASRSGGLMPHQPNTQIEQPNPARRAYRRANGLAGLGRRAILV